MSDITPIIQSKLSTESGRRRRPTSLAAHGEPAVWLMGASLTLSLMMIAGLLSLIAYDGFRAFWPREIQRIELASGEVVLGEPIRTETFTPTEAPTEERERTLYRVGNRDTSQASFRWVEQPQVATASTPDDVVLVERIAWGPWLGELERMERVTADGSVEVLSEGHEQTLSELSEQLPLAKQRLAEIESLQRSVIDRANKQREAWRLRVAVANRQLADTDTAVRGLSKGVWTPVLAAGLGSLAAGWAGRKKRWAVVAWCAAGLLLVGAWVEQPTAGIAMTAERVEQIKSDSSQAERELVERTSEAEARIAALVAANDEVRVLIREPRTGRVAPTSVSKVDDPLRVAQVVRVVPANELSLAQKWGVYLSRWREYLTDDPREANTEGGVWPVIFGTVVLTILLSLAVVPLGVIAAIYLREYAKQGVITSVLRIAINNLAGVPSIVYGVFGLGFFCYTLGAYVDSGPVEPLPRMPWWLMAAGLGVVVSTSVLMAASGRRASTLGSTASSRWLQRGAGIGWLSSVVLIVVLGSTTPYFHGFFADRAAENIPTFRSKGILWASLTLALLTLPVVIVATEEAIAAVPGSSRQGSYGCGASRWQTIRRIVLPGAMPGIMTGAILAMARGAGEVAPLMLVGAVKLSPDLPFDQTAPYIHLDRSFMHLGFHIFDLGYQSPDPEASRPLVWVTTLLLVAIVFALNSSAMLLRARLRKRMGGPVV